MAKIQKRDYFFGAALSLLLSKNKDARPSLIECSESSCQYRLSTDTSEDFILYMKYASSGTIRAGERIWQFSLSDTDKERIKACVDSGLRTFIILICGTDDLADGEIAVLTTKDYSQLAHKSGIRIKLVGKSPKKFIVADRLSSKASPLIETALIFA